MREFKVEIVEIDGKKHVKVHAQSEIIKHPDGRQDVIIHAPSLSLLSKQLNIGGK
jgi:hypothetical protein